MLAGGHPGHRDAFEIAGRNQVVQGRHPTQVRWQDIAASLTREQPNDVQSEQNTCTIFPILSISTS